MQIELVIGAADERFGQIHGIGDDGHDGQNVAAKQPVLGQRGQVAARQPVAADVAFLQVRGLDGEDVTLPDPG